MAMKKQIAWGTSKLLWFFLQNQNAVRFDYVVDDFTDRTEFCGIPVRRSGALAEERREECEVTIFAVSNRSLGEILHKLRRLGFGLSKEVRLYSEFFAESFSSRIKEDLGIEADQGLHRYVVSFTLNSRKMIHTTICGSWLFLELLNQCKSVPGDIAEVGCFEGGNALCALQSPVWPKGKAYYLFDSFEGFPDPSNYDPALSKKGDYASDLTVEEILDSFSMYPHAKVCRGFVPGTFDNISKEKRYSLVFYDCDLYQPALDTFRFFWERISPGGVLLIHDYLAEPGGFEGVRIATDEFFGAKNAALVPFWHNTMAVVRKE
jgi:hypothetical protein